MCFLSVVFIAGLFLSAICFGTSGLEATQSSAQGWHNDKVRGDSHERERQREGVRERVEEILKRLPARYNEPLSSVLHDTCSQIFCLIRAKLKYSNRLVLMLPPNTQEAYCTFLVFDLSVCRCLSVFIICQEDATRHGLANQTNAAGSHSRWQDG